MTVTEDTALFRIEVSHSMISGNAASNHSGKLRAAIRVETAEHKNGYRKVTKVLDAECRCKASEGEMPSRVRDLSGYHLLVAIGVC